MQRYIGSYKQLILGFLDRGYDSIEFPALSSPTNQLIIRHDIDFDCASAYQMSLIEDALGVKSTYFFMLCNDFYNLLSSENIDYIKRIQASGHKVSIHFDPTIYDNFMAGFEREADIFEKIFNEKIDVVSLHRPSEFFLNYNLPINGVEHTYQDRYFKEIKYISDSQGTFRFGHPHDSEAFNQNNTIHLLVHPIWWTSEGNSNIDVLKNFAKARQQLTDRDIARNCIPYQQYLAEAHHQMSN